MHASRHVEVGQTASQQPHILLPLPHPKPESMRPPLLCMPGGCTASAKSAEATTSAAAPSAGLAHSSLLVTGATCGDWSTSSTLRTRLCGAAGLCEAWSVMSEAHIACHGRQRAKERGGRVGMAGRGWHAANFHWYWKGWGALGPGLIEAWV